MSRTDAPRDPRRPEPGFWLVPLVPKGWAVPARLDLVDGIYTLEIDGANVEDAWSEEQLEALIADYLMANQITPIAKLALFGRRCTETEYRYRLQVKRWAAENHLEHPALTPTKPMRAGFVSPHAYFPE